ncbi:ATP-binding cassette domain-containing protein [Streptomyces sp. NPDC050164]|uniref:ATP-binding cassette domain-containing protein n=1 Tax=Streptomyces sp. NPDC050164 TaxID=3365605 RepID=UPI0037B41444
MRYEDVSFAYGNGPEVLRGYSLDIPAGQTVALIGPSGGGKSTLAKLLARLHNPTGSASSSTVSICGPSRRPICATAWSWSPRRAPSSPALLPRTSLWRVPTPRSTRSGTPPRRPGPHRFISALRDGYQTEIGGRDGRFSSGERQLIALARVFLVNTSVIVLDVATAVIDIPSERAVRGAMRAVFRGRTVLVVAHRLSTIQVADRVLVLADGRACA